MITNKSKGHNCLIVEDYEDIRDCYILARCDKNKVKDYLNHYRKNGTTIKAYVEVTE